MKIIIVGAGAVGSIVAQKLSAENHDVTLIESEERAVSNVQRSLDALVLKTLTFGPRHGYAVAKWLAEHSGDEIQVEEGSLYPALYRMERRGWISAEWGQSELGRRAKFYKLTAKGRQQLAAETEQWLSFQGAVSHVLLHLIGFHKQPRGQHFLAKVALV